MVGSMIRDVVLEFKSRLQHWMIRRIVEQRRWTNDVSIAVAEEENSSGPDDPTPRQSNESDYPTSSTSAVRISTDTQGHRVIG